MHDWLLTIIRCPITKQPMQRAAEEIVSEMKQRQQAGQLVSHQGIPIEDGFDGGLVNQSQTLFFRMQDSIPSLLPDEAIAI